MASSAKLNLEPIGAPLKINPTIKLLRWSFLGLGILYGVRRHHSIEKKENARLAYEAKMKPIWDKEKAEKKAIAEKIQNDELKRQGLDLS